MKKSSAIPPATPTKADEEFSWRNPLFTDVDAFLGRLDIFIDMYGSAHVGLPKTKNKKFVDALNTRGYKMEPIDVTSAELLDRKHVKKIAFYAISRTSPRD